MTKAPTPKTPAVKTSRTKAVVAAPEEPAEPVAIEAIPTEAPHPEEMRATFSAVSGSGATITATARCTPAGLVTTGLMVSAVLLSVASVIWAARRSPSR